MQIFCTQVTYLIYAFLFVLIITASTVAFSCSTPIYTYMQMFVLCRYQQSAQECSVALGGAGSFIGSGFCRLLPEDEVVREPATSLVVHLCSITFMIFVHAL